MGVGGGAGDCGAGYFGALVLVIVVLDIVVLLVMVQLVLTIVIVVQEVNVVVLVASCEIFYNLNVQVTEGVARMGVGSTYHGKLTLHSSLSSSPPLFLLPLLPSIP